MQGIIADASLNDVFSPAFVSVQLSQTLRRRAWQVINRSDRLHALPEYDLVVPIRFADENYQRNASGIHGSRSDILSSNLVWRPFRLAWCAKEWATMTNKLSTLSG